MKKTDSGLWVPDTPQIIRPSRRAFCRLGAAAAFGLTLPRPAHGTVWTYLRSVYVAPASTSGNFAAVDTSDAVMAIAMSSYAFSPPYEFFIAEAGINFTQIKLVQTSIYHSRLYYRILTNQSSSETFTFTTTGTGNEHSALILLFGVGASPSLSGTGVSATSSASVPSQTSPSADTIFIAGCARGNGSSIPSGIDSGFTPIYGTFSSGHASCSLAYKIEPSAGSANAPAWTVSGGTSTALGAMFTISAGGSVVRRRSIFVGR